MQLGGIGHGGMRLPENLCQICVSVSWTDGLLFRRTVAEVTKEFIDPIAIGALVKVPGHNWQ